MGDDLEKRVQELEDKQAILDVISAYGHYIDYGLKAEFADLFTEDAVYHVMFRGETMQDIGVPQPNGGIKGRDTIHAYVNAHTNAPAMFHKHMTSGSLIRLDGDKATAETYYQRLDEDDNGAFIMAFGRYVDDFIRCADGKWRFAKREANIESRFQPYGPDGKRL